VELNGILALSAIIGGTNSGKVFLGILTEINRKEPTAYGSTTIYIGAA
jgi:hypothetical protein